MGAGLSGGQMFLHNMRMLSQVCKIAFAISVFIVGVVLFLLKGAEIAALPWGEVWIYIKAKFQLYSDSIMGNSNHSYIYIENGKRLKSVLAVKVLKSHAIYLSQIKSYFLSIILLVLGIFLTSLIVVWQCFKGVFRRATAIKNPETKLRGASILSEFKLARLQRKYGLSGDLKIGQNRFFKWMQPSLIKDTEVRHILLAGSTGCGKTNFLNTLLPQIEAKGQAAIVVDNNGDMISRYYDAARGDIIFNPFDDRSYSWDFFEDCSDKKDIKEFGDAVFSFGKSKNTNAEPFWDNAANSVFVSLLEYAQDTSRSGLQWVVECIQRNNAKQLYRFIKSRAGASHFEKGDSNTAKSIESVLQAAISKIEFVRDYSAHGKFSLNDFLKGMKNGNKRWLFLASKPSTRTSLAPIRATLINIAIKKLMDLGEDKSNKLWFVLDELPALGNLPILTTAMSEIRKNGGCVIAGIQNLSQLYSIYGQQDASTILGNFYTRMYFQLGDATIRAFASKEIGTVEVQKSQKNTAMGANDVRDSVSYTTQEKVKPLVHPDEIGDLLPGEYYLLFMNRHTKVAKMSTPLANKVASVPAYVEYNPANHIQISQERQDEVNIFDDQEYVYQNEQDNDQQKSLNQSKQQQEVGIKKKKKITKIEVDRDVEERDIEQEQEYER